MLFGVFFEIFANFFDIGRIFESDRHLRPPARCLPLYVSYIYVGNGRTVPWNVMKTCGGSKFSECRHERR